MRFHKAHIGVFVSWCVDSPPDHLKALNLHQFLAQARLDHGPSLAVIDGRRRLSYHEVGERVDRLAAHLQERGLAPGDRLAVLMPNSLEFLEAYFAAAAAGLVLVPLNTRLNPRELASILGDSGARALLADGGLSTLLMELVGQGTALEGLMIVGETPDKRVPANLELWVSSHDEVVKTRPSDSRPSAPNPAPPEAAAQLYYTSGTTGSPKGVILTHANVSVHARAAIQELAITSDEVWGHFAPMYHLADAWATFAIIAVGGCHVMLPRFEAGAALGLIQDHRVTLTNLVPTMLNLMVKHPGVNDFDLSSLRLLLSGGAPIAPELVRQTMATFGCDYAQTYGLTETSPYLTLSLLPDHLLKLTREEQLAYKVRTGRPFMTVELRVVDETGRPVADDDTQVGEIQVRGPTVTPGYWPGSVAPQAMETGEDISISAIRSSFTPDGWLSTGDLATVDGEGFVNIVDRAKDMIITGGENVYSLEVEYALYEHPAVLEAAAFGLPDEHWGERVAAAVVFRPGAAADEGVNEASLVEFTRERLAGFKVPRSIFLVDELPKTGSGKIMKRELRERFSDE